MLKATRFIVVCLMICAVVSSVLLPSAAARIISASVYPTRWTRLQGDRAVYHVIVLADGPISLRAERLPRGTSARFDRFDPPRLTLTTTRETPLGTHTFDVIISTPREERRIPVTINIVSRTLDGSSVVICESYAKFLSPMYWAEVGVVALATFSHNFGTSFTNPFSLLREILMGMIPGELSTAIDAINIVFTLRAFLTASGMAHILGFTSPGLPITDDWDIRPLREIASLIERGERSEALRRIRELLPLLHIWFSNIERFRVDGLIVTEHVKRAASNLVLSCIKFLEYELVRLSPVGITVRVISPNGGEVWGVGERRQITWDARYEPPIGIPLPPHPIPPPRPHEGIRIDIFYSTDGGRSWRLIVRNIPNTGSYDWTIPDTPSTNCLVRVDAYDAFGRRGSDTSDRPFTILRRSITVLIPNGGEVWPIGSTQTISWRSEGVTGDVRIDLSRDGGRTWTTIIPRTLNDGSEPWTVTGPPTTRARIRVVSLVDTGIWDMSDRDFTIRDATPPIVRVTSPNGGEVWRVGETRRITWTASDDVGVTRIDIFYSTDGGRTWILIARGLPNTGFYDWRIPNTPSTSCLVRVDAYDAAGNIGSDTSDRHFTIRR